jgi:Sulfotransferase family
MHATPQLERLLIVGLPRSGTTLLATLLGAQPKVHFLTDYFAAFNEAAVRLGKNWNEQLELSERRIALALVRDQFLRVRHPVLLKPESFSSVDELHRLVLAELVTGGEEWVGHKLLLAPEQLRRVLAKTQIHCLLMVRDCRDAALSYFHRTGGGVERYVRNWSETVRVSLELQGHPRLLALRFEDLIGMPEATLERLGAWLRIPIDANVAEFRFQRSRAHGGTHWRENSAFGDVQRRFDPKPIGRWQTSTNSSIVRYAGWAARRELRALGYAPPSPLSPSERSRFYAIRTLERAEHRAHDSVSSAGQWLRRGLVRLGP